MRKILSSIIVLFLLTGCGSIAERHYKATGQYNVIVEQEKKIAKEFFEQRWQFYAGALDEAIRLYPNAIPPIILSCKDGLDQIQPDAELTDRQLGQIAILRAFILSEAFQQLLDAIIPLGGYVF